MISFLPKTLFGCMCAITPLQQVGIVTVYAMMCIVFILLCVTTFTTPNKLTMPIVYTCAVVGGLLFVTGIVLAIIDIGLTL